MALLLRIPPGKKTDDNSYEKPHHSEYRINGMTSLHFLISRFYSEGANSSLKNTLSMTVSRRLVRSLALLLLSFFFLGCRAISEQTVGAKEPPPILQAPSVPDGLPVISALQPSGSIPHDRKAFTQGLLYHDGNLYESTGIRGKSTVRRLDPKSGDILTSTPIPAEFFGEGLAFWEDKFYQLTWLGQTCFVFNKELELESRLFYSTEQGWGLTVDPENNLFVFSDGSAVIRFLEPKNLITRRKIQVLDGNQNPVTGLNELEWVKGEIWANVWTSDSIVRIDPLSGQVKGWFKLTDLVKQFQSGPEDVLNGIAYDPEQDRLWLTGKLWPKIFWFDNVSETFFSRGD